MSTLLLVACSSHQDAAESTFKTALQEYYTSHPACFHVGLSFPYRLAQSQRTGASQSSILNELVSLGLLEASPTEMESRSIFRGQPAKMESATRFVLTDLGQQVTRAPEQHLFSSGGTLFCYGDYEVTSVSHFSDPADFMDHKVSQVSFAYKAVRIADWALNSQVLQRHFSQITRDIQSEQAPIEERTTLILTNEGWVHERLSVNSRITSR
ncbi:hypothetical protein [Nitrincola sp. MINF-07-Sa-05]|uniref:hypothetical protein n=1 Tax=Nitrincola salilacus TaxID=3400273 RepID=UPI0039181B81